MTGIESGSANLLEPLEGHQRIGHHDAVNDEAVAVWVSVC